MRNSGFSVASCQFVLVHGVVKFIEMLKCSNLPKSDPKFKPLYNSSKHDIFNRKLHKMLAKTSWYDELELVKKTKWRDQLPEGWRGSKPVQYRIPGVKYTSIMQVPNSKGGRLLSMLAKAEPRLYKMTGYQVKYVEASGRQLSKSFPKDFSSNKCFRSKCAVCSNSEAKGPTLCQVKGVVYSCVCVQCDREHKANPEAKHKGCYIGETARTLSERAEEHKKSLKRYDNKSFMFKHWALNAPDLLTPPKFKFSVMTSHKDPLSRLVREAVVIEHSASMNSRAEWGGYKIPRLTVEKSDWETRSDIEKKEYSVKGEMSEMLNLKNRVVAYAQRAGSDINVNFSCRKRMASGSSKINESAEAGTHDQTDQTAQPNKKTKFTGITTGDGVWDPKLSKFASKIGKKPAASTPNKPLNTATTSTPADKVNVRPLTSASSIESIADDKIHVSGLSSNQSDEEFLLVATLDMESAITVSVKNIR